MWAEDLEDKENKTSALSISKHNLSLQTGDLRVRLQVKSQWFHYGFVISASAKDKDIETQLNPIKPHSAQTCYL